ncbi:methylated-DNA--[protein]-cysteine S-methyltransferase [Geomonas azotofigens]|uniref:methylated-DNA--[protein]-cysteine S-methyltransferase n=1 Tax=Geomonas azotofigens TaxID=2843196 RepID=UPI001C0FBF9D|nr:methylated-DNA--[protein]-cysteine S-methyltransferase [Geomonas azotofigens]MBU5614959.1 methylated-DNA--[protein]-cysteine S-methyltransferase [Geomonas azotofigens]
MRDRSAVTAWTMYETGAGCGVLAASEHGVVAHHLPYGAKSAAEALELAAALYPRATGENELTAKGAALLRRYFGGERVVFDLPLDLDGCTPFQKNVYHVVAAIPYGTVLSYQDVAGACGSPRGARAIGGAMARNLVPIIIPCHRVVGANGVMTGFTAPGGTDSKRELLSMEGVNLDAKGGVTWAKIR